MTETLKVQGVPTATDAPESWMVVGAVTVKVPPHWLLVALTTVRPVGMLSVKPTPVSAAGLPAGFVIVKVRLVDVFCAMVPAANALAIDGGPSTLRVAEAGRPLPPSIELTELVVLVSVPSALAVTFTENVQEAVAASVAPERLTEALPGTALMIPEPHEPVKPLLGETTVKPEGKLSVKPMPVCAAPVSVLWTVKLRVVVPFCAMLPAPNDLLRVGGAPTVRVAVAVAAVPVPPLEELGVTLLVKTPGEEAVTDTVTAQFAPGAKVAPLRFTLPPDCVAVPEQVLFRLAGDATVIPVGSVSVNCTAVSVALVFELESPKVTVEVPPGVMMLGEKLLVIAGALITVRVAEAAAALPAAVELRVAVTV